MLGPGEGLPDALVDDQDDDTADAEVIQLAACVVVRRRNEGEVEVVGVSPAASLPAGRFERSHGGELLRWSRSSAVEQRIDDIADQCFEGATQADLIEVETRRVCVSME